MVYSSLVWNIYLLMYHVQRTMNIAGKCFITDPNYQGVSSMTIVITARRKKIHLYEEWQISSRSWTSDKSSLSWFCKNLLYFYVRSFSLHLKKRRARKPLEIGIRNSVSKNTYEDLCIGLEILMPYMCKTESGKVIINAEGYLSCDSYYRSILVNPKTGVAELVIYRKGRFDHRQKPNTREPRKWLNEDIIIKEFPNIRIVFLYIISCRYQQHFKNRDI